MFSAAQISVDLLKKYNLSTSLAIIANFPVSKAGELHNLTGVAWYTYNLAPNFKSRLAKSNRKLIIFAEKTSANEEVYEYDDMLIVRCWKKGDPLVFVALEESLSQFNHVKKVFLQFEFNMYGEAFTSGLFPFFVLFSKLKGRDVTLLLHQVLNDLKDLGDHLGLKKKTLKYYIYQTFFRKFFQLVVPWTGKTIVHDQFLKEKLQTMVKHPVFVVPLGLTNKAKVCSLIEARKALKIQKGDFVVLCFGFLTWYKGSDWIINKFVEFFNQTGDTKIKLIMAGGKSANLEGKRFYENYYDKLVARAQKSPNISITGYIKEENVAHYFCSADAVILPYRVHMSASGPFAHALAFDRPFLLSTELGSVLDTSDIQEIMYDMNITKKDLLFKLEGMDLFKKITQLVQSREQRQLRSTFSEKIKDARDWNIIAGKFLYLIDA
jgi:glycosyltransferase involved in cell wall biosynthesis